MPLIADSRVLRTILQRDRPWAAYALGDLSPGVAEHCRWFALPDPSPALLLLYHRFDPPILFAFGSPAPLARLIEEIDAPVVSLQVRADALPAIRTRYRVGNIRAMWRMVVDPEGARPLASGETAELTAADVGAIERLYADGHRRSEGPDFFDPSMVEQGIFRGVWEGEELVSVAGTHLVVPSEGVCAVGNVYTRHDRRHQGLGARVTSAVVSNALARGSPTVVLNVDQENGAAIRVYRRLGFRVHCDFVEGLALRS